MSLTSPLPPALVHTGSLLLAGMAVLLAERTLVWLARRALDAARPLLGEPDDAVAYEQGLLTPGGIGVPWLWAGLAATSLTLWLGHVLHGAAYVAAGTLLLATLGWDLWTRHCVAASARHIAWRRGWRKSVRRLPLAQVVAAHVVERPLGGWPARLAARLGLRLGWAYLALEFHSGRAAKLPRTDLTFGLPQVRRMAQFILQRQDQAMRERRHAIREALRARRSAPRILPDPEELALRRELAALRSTLAPHPRRGRELGLPRLPWLPDSTAG